MPPSPKAACCLTLITSLAAATTLVVTRLSARNAKQVEGNVGAAELHLTDEEIAAIEGKNIYEPELVTAA